MGKKAIIVLASIGIVGGVGAGVYFGMEDTPSTKAGHKSEDKVKEVAEHPSWQNLLDKDNKSSKDKDKKTNKKDVLASILEQRTDVEKRIGGVFLPDRSNNKGTDGINNVALQAIDVLNTQAEHEGTFLASLEDKKPLLANSGHSSNGNSGLPTDLNNNTIGDLPLDPNAGNNGGSIIDPIDPNEGNGGGTIIDPPITPPVDPPVTPPIEPNDAPVITAYDQQYHVGDNFDAYASVSAYDTEDGDLSHQVKVVTNTVNMNEEGTYKVTYQVTDSKGARTTFSISVKVLNDAPIIVAANKTISVGSNFNPMRGVIAWDKEDGNISGKVEVLLNNVNTNKAGDYQVVYGVQDQQGKQTTKKISVTVTNEAPTIVANDVIVEQGTAFEPLTSVTANDKEDGDITDRVIVVKNTVNTEVVGDYEVTYQVTDRHGLTTEKTITVHVTHTNVAPTIQAEDVIISKDADFDVLSEVSAFDAEDGDLTHAIKVIKNEVNMAVAGVYEVTYQVTDSNGETVEKTITVTVTHTNVAPTIHAEDVVIRKDADFDVLSKVSASDEEDGDITNQIKVTNNTVDMTTSGIYEVTYQVTDSDGETTEKTVKVTVIELVPFDN